jgi:hypothetical protein
MGKEPEVKANLVTATMAFIGSTLGEPALKTILASMDSRQLTPPRGLLPSDRILERSYRDLLVGAGKCLAATPGARKPKDYFFEMGKYLANDGINKYYKSLVRMFDTRFMLTKSPHIWGVIHSHGSLSVEPITDTSCYVYIADYPAPCQEFCYMMAGYMWAVAEMTKADGLRIDELECVNRGAKRCKFFGEWKASSKRQKA